MATSNFEKVGESFPHSVVNLSGERRPYTIQAPRLKGGPTSSMQPGEGSGAPARSSALNNEAHGPQFTPTAKIVYANSEESGKTQRNTRFLNGPRRGSFWTKRLEGPQIGK